MNSEEVWSGTIVRRKTMEGCNLVAQIAVCIWNAMVCSFGRKCFASRPLTSTIRCMSAARTQSLNDISEVWMLNQYELMKNVDGALPPCIFRARSLPRPQLDLRSAGLPPAGILAQALKRRPRLAAYLKDSQAIHPEQIIFRAFMCEPGLDETSQWLDLSTLQSEYGLKWDMPELKKSADDITRPVKQKEFETRKSWDA